MKFDRAKLGAWLGGWTAGVVVMFIMSFALAVFWFTLDDRLAAALEYPQLGSLPFELVAQAFLLVAATGNAIIRLSDG